MRLSSIPRAGAASAAIIFVAGCAGGAGSPASFTGSNAPQSNARAAHPLPHASGAPWRRVGSATAVQARTVRGQGTVLVSDTFAESSTSKHTWFDRDDTCLTAGTASQPTGSIPACGANAPQDPPGEGALELTTPDTYQIGLVSWHKALPTANGLDVQFTLYAFDGTAPGADGTLLYFSNGSLKHPIRPGGNGGSLGYVAGGSAKKGLANAYLGVGFDEYGNFSSYLPGGPGFIPETVAVGGAASIGYPYLGGVTDGSGVPSSLPFDLDQPSATSRPANAPTIDVTLTAAGLLEVAIDIHDGNGPLTYLSENIVGVAGQPAVPATVYVGFEASTGGLYNRHQIGGVTISTLQ
jgi:hypothetical protein